MNPEDPRDRQCFRDEDASAIVPALPVIVVEIGDSVAVLDPLRALDKIEIGSEHLVEHDDCGRREGSSINGEKVEGARHSFRWQNTHEINVPGEDKKSIDGGTESGVFESRVGLLPESVAIAEVWL